MHRKNGSKYGFVYAKTDTLHYSSHQILKDILSSNPEIYGNCLAFKPYISNGQTIYNAPYCYKNDKQLCYKNLADKSYDYLSWDWYRIPAEETARYGVNLTMMKEEKCFNDNFFGPYI
jgi:sigma-B regulation protein RsbU (phosphoserine phosphatase)